MSEIRRRVEGAIREGAEAALLEAGNVVLERARAQAPVGTPPDDEHSGRLKESGRVVLEGNSVVVSFNTPYAAKQELDVRLHHHTGKAHYLQDALKMTIPQLQGIFAGRVRARVQGRG